ncbi:MAG: signal peptidase II [Lachnospiraceae bacterium]
MKLIGVPIGVFTLDYFIKKKIDTNYRIGEKKEICNGKVILEKHYNKGAALNILQDRPLLLHTLTSVMLGVIAVRFLTLLKKEGHIRQKIACGMMLGGGLSNFYDRVTKGHVVDYIRFPGKNKKLSQIVYNISDFMIFIGALFMS